MNGREQPPPQMCAGCIYFAEARTDSGPRRWCTDQRSFGTITEPEPRCKGLTFRARPERREH